jgi:hypothetical protein
MLPLTTAHKEDVMSKFVDGGGGPPASNGIPWQQYAQMITGAVERGAHSIIEAGMFLNEAHDSLSNDDWQSLIKELGYNKSTISKYRSIGRTFEKVSHAKLPASSETLYILTQLSPEDLQAALAIDQITQDLDRKAAIALVGSSEPDSDSEDAFDDFANEGDTVTSTKP